MLTKEAKKIANGGNETHLSHSKGRGKPVFERHAFAD